MLFLSRLTVVALGFPVAAIILNTPFLLLALVLDRVMPSEPSPFLLRAAMAVQLIVVVGGALYACWWMWPRAAAKGQTNPR